MSVEMIDKSGQIREPQDFAEARAIVIKRLCSFPPPDPELYLQFTTIIQALEIAEAISRKRYGTNLEETRPLESAK